MKNLREELDQRRVQKLYRVRRIAEQWNGTEVFIEGRRLISFCGNDYLGLTQHPAIKKALIKGVEYWGAGAGAAHLVCGHSRAHHVLEEALATFTGRPRALLFSTGYMANLGIATALVRRGSTIFQDRLNHASLIDAASLCGARLRRYKHANPPDLQEKLRNQTENDTLIMTDAIFSMDGDLAPLPELSALARQHHAILMVDDAHGLGVLGESGRGTLSHFKLNTDQVPILMGTLGKAFGVFGAFVAGEEDLIETLIQKARTYIYTTALPSALAAACHTGLHVLEKESWRRERLFAHIQYFKHHLHRAKLPLMESCTPIQPLMIGNPEQALTFSEQLFDAGLMVTAIRPPTVPPNTARLRITLSATHTEAEVNKLIETLITVWDLYKY